MLFAFLREENLSDKVPEVTKNTVIVDLERLGSDVTYTLTYAHKSLVGTF